MDRVDLIVHVEDFALVESRAIRRCRWKVWVWIASSKAWRSRYWRTSGLVTCLKIASTMLLPTKLSAVLKKPKLRMMTRLSSSLKRVGFPELDVFAHGHFGWHPVVGAAIEIMFPCPFVFEGHELVDIDLIAVDQPLFIDVDALFCTPFAFLLTLSYFYPFLYY